MKTRFPSVMAALLVMGVGVDAATNYVWQASSNPTPPYSSWETAAHVIQDAVEAASDGDTVLVTNGVYRGRAGCYAADLTKPITLQSVNGPDLTTISGGGLSRGPADLGAGAILSGFKLTSSSGKIGVRGAGISKTLNSVVSNCIITLNRQGATNAILIDCVISINGLSTLWTSVNSSGSGASCCVLRNCLLIGNQALSRGGGVVECLLDNCTLVGNAAISGRDFDLAVGGGAYRSTLNNCILTGNSANVAGGGAYVSTLNNCTLTDNVVTGLNKNIRSRGGGAGSSRLVNCLLVNNTAGLGGGASRSKLIGCVLIGNTAFLPASIGGFGGGAWRSSLVNCTVVGNYARVCGGGDFRSWLTNCIVYYNTAPDEPNYPPGSALHYTCTFPVPAKGGGNITNAPLFVDTNHWSDLRLQPNSPCIDAGNNAFVTTLNDSDGNPRIAGGTVDIGAYEFQFP